VCVCVGTKSIFTPHLMRCSVCPYPDNRFHQLMIKRDARGLYDGIK
jgi:hypothetical protein